MAKPDPGRLAAAPAKPLSGAGDSAAAPPTRLQPLIQTKLSPPRSGGALIARVGLTGRLRDSRHHRFIGIRAPAGAGKTTLVAAWRQLLMPLGYEVAWLTLTPEDNAAGRFLDYLIASLGQVDSRLVKDAAALLRQQPESEPADAVVIALINAIAGYRRELTLVVDDYHHVSLAAIRDALQLLLDYAPQNLHLLVTSRGALPFDLARLRAQGQAIEFDYHDLRFSFAESEAFLKLRIGDIGKRDARRLHDRSDGWAAGLQLLSIDLKRHAVAGPQPRTAVRNARDFADYFTRQVLTRLSPQETELLIKLSVCRRFSATLCTEILQSGNTAALLQRVENDDLFIVRFDEAGREPWYRVHPLLRELLLELFGQLPAAAQHQVHAAASAWFRRQGFMTEAIHHALGAGEHRRAAEMVEAAARELIWEGDPKRLAYFLEQLAQSDAGLSLPLRFWSAWIQYLHRRFENCRRLLDPVEADLPAGDHELRRHLALLRGCLAIQHEDNAAMLSLRDALPPLLDDADGDIAGGARNVLGVTYVNSLQFEQAREVLTAARGALADGGQRLSSPFGWFMARSLLGATYVKQGDMVQAERVLRAALQQGEQALGQYAMPACNAAVYLGDVLYEIDQADAARSLIEERLDVIDRIALPDTLLTAYLTLARACWRGGLRSEALATLEQLQEQAQQRGLDRLLADALAQQLQFDLAMRSEIAADERLRRLDALARKHAGVGEGPLAAIAPTARLARIHWHRARGEQAAAAILLPDLLRLAEARRQYRLLVQLQLIGAAIEPPPRRSEAERAVRAALELGQRLGLLRSFLDAGAVVLGLIQDLARAATLDPVLVPFLQRLLLQALPAGGGAAPSAKPLAADALSTREMEILRSLVDCATNKKIARALGISPETVKWHLKNVYAKLGVIGRDDAISRGRDLELI